MEMLRVKIGTILLVALVIGVVSCKDDDDDDNNNNGIGDDGKNEVVIAEISQRNKAEIQFSQLASTFSLDSSVIEYSEKMVNGHQNAQEELDSLAEERNVDVPDSLSTEHDSLVNYLSALTGYDFDTAYINMQILMHTETKDIFEAIRDTTEDHDLMTYVNKHLPDVNAHLMQADSISEILMTGSDTTGGDTTNYSMKRPF